MSSPNYDGRNWFWRHDDGSLYGSKANAIITEADAGYQAFIDRGGFPTTWPRDENGQQTDDALNEVLQPYGITYNG